MPGQDFNVGVPGATPEGAAEGDFGEGPVAPRPADQEEQADVNIPPDVNDGDAPPLSPALWEDPALAPLKIETKRVIPYATVRIQNSQIDKLQDKIEAKRLERQIDGSIIKKLYALNQGGLVTTLLGEVDQEIEEVEMKIDAVESLARAYEHMSIVFSRQAQMWNMAPLIEASLEVFGTDPLSRIRPPSHQGMYLRMAQDLFDMPSREIGPLTTTHIYLQCLIEAEFALDRGASRAFTGKGGYTFAAQVREGELSISRPGRIIVNNPNLGNITWEGRAAEDITSDFVLPADEQIGSIKRLDQIGVKSHRNYDGVIASDPNTRLPDFAERGVLDQVAYYCTLLSREFLLSAGLGRLRETPLGQKFGGSAENWAEKLFGVQVANGSSDKPGPPGSLMNLVMSDAEGRPEGDFLFGSDQPANHAAQGRVLLFEDIHGVKPGEITTAGKLWVDSVKSAPFNNTMGTFDTALQGALNRLRNAEQFLEILLCRDKERTLLTPRGLFIRIIKDFATMLVGITVESDSMAQRAAGTEFALLSLAQQPGEFAGDFTLQAGQISNPDPDGFGSPLGAWEAYRLWGTREFPGSDTDFQLRNFTQGMHDSIASTQTANVGQLRHALTFFQCCGAINSRKPPAEGEEVKQLRMSGQGNIRSAIQSHQAPMRMKMRAAIIESADHTYQSMDFRRHIPDDPDDPMGEGSTVTVTNNSALGATNFGGAIATGMRHFWRRGGYILTEGIGEADPEPPNFPGILEGIIVKIFEDLQAEALALADAEGKTYLREGGTTLNGGFDGAITISIILNCFIQLTRLFVDVKMELDPITSSMRSFLRVGLAQRAISREGGDIGRASAQVATFLDDSFDANQINIYHRGNNSETNSVNKVRRLLEELAAAAEGDDLSSFLNHAGGVVGPLPHIPIRANLAIQTSPEQVSPHRLVDIIHKLAREDDHPTTLFSLAHASVQNLSDKSTTFSLKAAALRSARRPTDPEDTDDIKLLREMSTPDSVGHKFIRALSDTQIKWARKRVATLKNVSTDNYMLNDVNLDMFKAYQMLLEAKRSTGFTSGVVLFLGMPIRSFLHERKNRNWNPRDWDKAFVDFQIDKFDAAQPALAYVTLGHHPEQQLATPGQQAPQPPRSAGTTVPSFFLNISTSKELISEAMALDPPPVDFNELVTRVKFNSSGLRGPAEPMSWDGAGPSLSSAWGPNRSGPPGPLRVDHLRYELESFILKHMYQDLTGFALIDEMVQFDTAMEALLERDSRVVGLSQELMAPLGLPDAVISEFFSRSSFPTRGGPRRGGVFLPAIPQLNRLTQPQATGITRIDSGVEREITTWALPKIQQAQLLTLYNLLSTKPFFVGRVNDLVLTKTVFDRVFAVFVDLNSFEVSVERTAEDAQGEHFVRGMSDVPATWHDIILAVGDGAEDLFTMTRLYAGADLEVR